MSGSDSSDKPVAIPDSVYASLDASGFPFQTAIEGVVSGIKDWKLIASEFPWQEEDGSNQFLDMVALHDYVYLVIECKKTNKDVLTFLKPLPDASPSRVTDRVRALDAEQDAQTPRLILRVSEWTIAPRSAESKFCVVSTSASGKDGRMLEREAGRVVRATDAFAVRARDGASVGVSMAGRRVALFLPVIVTNAPLYVARYAPSAVSLDTGEFAERPTGIESVAWVRFRKTFTSAGGFDLGERTVFVVNAASLHEFMIALEDTAHRLEGGRVILPERRR